jgi:hypothetical protein
MHLYEYITDSISGKTFLIDTGAAVSVFTHQGPPSSAEWYLSGPDNKTIPSWGSTMKQLCSGGKTFTFNFILAAVA